MFLAHFHKELYNVHLTIFEKFPNIKFPKLIPAKNEELSHKHIYYSYTFFQINNKYYHNFPHLVILKQFRFRKFNNFSVEKKIKSNIIIHNYSTTS